MDVIKRASFASKQVKAGPAPLASFEDLPSDELESPEEFSIVRTNVIDLQIEEVESQDHQSQNPDSLTFSSHSTPQIESDFDSHCTLTPGDPFESQSSDLRTTSLSSLSKEDVTALCVQEKKGSALSLGECDVTDSECVQRKSSWTDIFRSHNQNSAKTPVSQTPQCDIIPANKVSKKKTRSEAVKKEIVEPKSKEKGKFLSLFKVGKKGPKNIESPVSPDDCVVSSQIKNVSEILQPIPSDLENVASMNNGHISEDRENDIPQVEEVDSKPTVIDTQNDLDKLNVEHSEKIPDERKLSRKNFNVSEKEYNILSAQTETDKNNIVLIQENIKPNAVEEESSESELVFEVKNSVEEKEVEDKEDEVDFEAENLLSHDEIDEDSSIELRPVVLEAPKQSVIASRQQRLEITTKPIERPRSTTPINIAPLEAFIQSVSPTFDSKVEKIKLSLPGDQFLGRIKSPKKSSVKSWTDFCEKGLHSPRMPKRIDEDDFQDSLFESEEKNIIRDPFSEQIDTQWAAFDANFQNSEPNVFGDNFINASNSVAASQINCKHSYQHFEVNFPISQCSCECHVYGCNSCPSEESISEDCKLCTCHQKALGNVNIRESVSIKATENNSPHSDVEPF